MAKCIFVFLGLLLTLSFTTQSRYYDAEVVRELREQLAALEDQAYKQRAEDEPQVNVDTTTTYIASSTSASPTNIPDEVKDTEETADTGCPLCGRASVCCRVGETFSCCKKIYSAENQQIEVDEINNSATYFYKNGAIRILDFKKGILSAYEPKDDACYVAAGLDYTLDDVLAAAEGKNTKDNKATQPHFYRPIDAKPLEDTSLLPESLLEKCDGKPVFWDERVTKETAKLETRDLSRFSRDESICVCCCDGCSC